MIRPVAQSEGSAVAELMRECSMWRNNYLAATGQPHGDLEITYMVYTPFTDDEPCP